MNHSPHSTEHSGSSQSHSPQAQGVLVLPGGQVGDVSASLLQELVNDVGEPMLHIGAQDTTSPSPGGEEAEELRELKQKPWYKRPSAYWLICLVPFSAMAMSTTLTPKVEILTNLACRQHKPEYFSLQEPPVLGPLPVTVPSLNSSFSFRSTRPSSELLEFTFNAPEPLELDESIRRACASDPVVQAAVAKLTAVMTTSSGILACMTTGFWGSMSDRYGRIWVMGIAVWGLLLLDFNFIFVTLFSERLPGGYWFLVVGPLLEGLLGGMNTAVAANHAYIADCTSSSDRSRIYSLSLGLMFTGMALGPVLGSILIRLTHFTLIVFYLAAAAHFVYACFIWFIIPESLSPKTMAENRDRYERENTGAGEQADSITRYLSRTLDFLKPLAALAPMEVPNEGGVGRRRGKDWNLTLLVIGFGFVTLLISSYTYKFQYAAATFGWTSEELGYWLSLVVASRAFFLTVILPVVIKFIKSATASQPRDEFPIEPSESDPLLRTPTPGSSSETSDGSTLVSESAVSREVRRDANTPLFDLNLARVSLLLEAVCFFVVPFATSAAMFTVFTMLTACASGVNPAIQALAIELFARTGHKDTGRLFGAIGVVQTICSSIIGPSLYGVIYLNTVGTFPKTIFFVSAFNISVALFFVSLVRLPQSGNGVVLVSGNSSDTDIEGLPGGNRSYFTFSTDLKWSSKKSKKPRDVSRGRKRKTKRLDSLTVVVINV